MNTDSSIVDDVWLLDMSSTPWKWSKVDVGAHVQLMRAIWCHPVCKVGKYIVVFKPATNNPSMYADWFPIPANKWVASFFRLGTGPREREREREWSWWNIRNVDFSVVRIWFHVKDAKKRTWMVNVAFLGVLRPTTKMRTMKRNCVVTWLCPIFATWDRWICSGRQWNYICWIHQIYSSTVD